MRILHISSSRTFGETERHLTCLCRELAGRGHEVFVALRPTSEWQHELAFLPAERRLHVSVRNSFGMLSARRIARFVQDRNIEIVHAHSGKDYLAGSAVRRAEHDVRLVLTRHAAAALKPFHRFALRGVDAAIALSPETHKLLKLTFDADKVFSVTAGIQFDASDSGTFDALGREFRAFHGIPGDARLIVAVGDLVRSAGPRDLVLAASEVVKEIPNAHFVIVGTDPSTGRQFRRELKRLAKVLGLESCFVWLEAGTSMSELLAAADVFVSPGHSGGISRSCLEAIVAAVPVIATSSDGLLSSEAVVPAQDPVALAERIILFLNDPELAARCVDLAGQTARARFSTSKMADEVEAVYRHVLAH